LLVNSGVNAVAVIKSLFFAAILSAAMPLSAYHTGKDLAEMCQFELIRQGGHVAEVTNRMMLGWCAGFIVASFEHLLDQRHVCLAGDYGADISDKLMHLIDHYLIEHPEQKDDQASAIIKQALGDAFPCVEK
jgi:hypothetical protein